MKFLKKVKVEAQLNEAAGCLPFCPKTGRVLLGRRSKVVDSPSVWSGWGGHREIGEDRHQTVEREFREETKYSGPVKMRFIYTYERPDNGFRYHNFWAVVPEEFWPEPNHEVDSWEWVDLRMLENWPSPMHEGMMDLLKKIWSTLQTKGN